LFSLKGEGSNNSNCLLWQRCWLLRTYCSEYKATTATVCCGSASNCCAPAMVNTEQQQQLTAMAVLLVAVHLLW
jgi:hypothetical protein